MFVMPTLHLLQKSEGLVFVTLHNLTLTRALVIDAAEVKHPVDNHTA